MKTANVMDFEKMPGSYQKGLVMMFMSKAIHDEVDYENAVEVIDGLVGHELSDEQKLMPQQRRRRSCDAD